MDNLPDLIIQEILCRLSIKDLLKSRMVCSEWRSIIHSDYFKKKHFEESKLNPDESSIIIVKGAALNHLESTLHFWYPNNNNNNNNNNNHHSQKPFNLAQFLERDNNNNNNPAELMALNVNDFMFRKFGAVNGLVILGWDILYVIWNPSINQFKTFQGPRLAFRNYRYLMYYGCSRRTTTNRADNNDLSGFGFDPVSQDYKFVIGAFMPYSVSLFRHEINIRPFFHVYSLRNNSWMRRSFLNLPIRVAGLVNGDGYTEDGKFYWFAKRCGDNSIPSLIVFDFNTEHFDWMPLPKELNDVHEAVAVGNFKDLDLLTTFIHGGGQEDDLRCELWQIKKHEDGSSSWSRKCTLEFPCEIGSPIGLMKGSGQMIFEASMVGDDDEMSNNKDLLLINPITQVGINLGFIAPEILVFNFVNTLFSVNLLSINKG